MLLLFASATFLLPGAADARRINPPEHEAQAHDLTVPEGAASFAGDRSSLLDGAHDMISEQEMQAPLGNRPAKEPEAAAAASLLEASSGEQTDWPLKQAVVRGLSMLPSQELRGHGLPSDALHKATFLDGEPRSASGAATATRLHYYNSRNKLGVDHQDHEHAWKAQAKPPTIGQRDHRAKTLKEEDAATASLPPIALVDGTDGHGYNLKVEMPMTWAPHLRNVLFAENGLGYEVYSAEFRGKPVSIKVAKPQDSEVSREQQALERLAFSGNVLALLDGYTYSHRTYRMIEAGDTGGLRKTLTQWHSERGMRPIDLNLTLPILVDMLRALRDMEIAGVVHSALTEKNVVFLDSESGKMVLTDFGTAHLTDEMHENHHTHWIVNDIPSLMRVHPIRRWSKSRHTYNEISPFKQAPEAVKMPSDPANDVWSVGAMFAQLCLGYSPIRRAVLQVDPMAKKTYGERAAARVRSLIHSHFELAEDPGYQKLDPEVQDLIQGMLNRNPVRRWSAAGTLAVAERIAEERHIPLHKERAPLNPSTDFGIEHAWQ